MSTSGFYMQLHAYAHTTYRKEKGRKKKEIAMQYLYGDGERKGGEGRKGEKEGEREELKS